MHKRNPDFKAAFVGKILNLKYFLSVTVKNIDGRVKTFVLLLKDLKGRPLIAGLPTRSLAFIPSPVHI